MADVSVVITSFNSKEYTDQCLGSLLISANETIVVDDASTDGTAEMIKAKYPSVKLIVNPDNLGYVRSNNIGMRSAGGKYIFSLNNDTLISKDAIEKLEEFLRSHPDAGAVGPKLVNRDGTLQKQCRRAFPTPLNSLSYFSGLSKLFPKNSYLLENIDDSVTQEVDCLCGASMMVRREAIDEVGLMDERYHMYGDDIDWCYRMKQNGWKIYYLPDAEIVHFGGMGGSRKRSFRSLFEFYRSMALFFKLHYAGSSPYIFNWLVYCGIWMKYSMAVLQNLIRKDKYVGTKKP